MAGQRAALRFLLATDGTPGADEAVKLIVTSLRPEAVGEVVVVTVAAGHAGDPAYARMAHALAELDPAAVAEAVADGAADRLAEAGFQAHGEVLHGHAAEAIVDRAAAGDVGCVVLGTRGLHGLERMLVGSVAGTVARHAPTPVLVVRSGRPIERVIVGFDGSPSAASALRFAAGLPLRGDPSITVCTTYDVPAPLASGIAPTMLASVEAARREDLLEARSVAAATAEDGVAAITGRGVRATAHVAHGSPVDQLTRVAGELGADLIVVGDRGRSDIERFVLGSTSAGLVAAPPTSILVVRPDMRRPS